MLVTKEEGDGQGFLLLSRMSLLSLQARSELVRCVDAGKCQVILSHCEVKGGGEISFSCCSRPGFS